MATITLSLSEKKNEIGHSEILIRFSVSKSQRYRVKSGLFISENRWTKKNEISIPKIETKERKEIVQLSSKLESLKKHILTHFEQSDKTAIDKRWLELCIDKFHFPEKYTERGITFFDLFDEYLSKKKYSESRKNHIRVVYRSLQRYELYKKLTVNESFVLNFDEMNSDTLLDIENFLYSENEIYKDYPGIYEKIRETRKPKLRGKNTVIDLLQKIRTFVLWCLENEKIVKDPFDKFEIGVSVYGTPYYITIEERNKLYSTDLSENKTIETQRDIFVFQCLVGCRVSDLYKMTQKSVINGAVEYIAGKTKEGNPITIRVPLNAIALEIIERYKDENRKLLFPFISQYRYNLAIKEAFKLADLTRIVTVLNQTTREEEKRPLNEIASSHLARRTFIGNLYKKVKDPNLIAPMSGHVEGSKAFARYRDIDEEMKTDLVNLLL